MRRKANLPVLLKKAGREKNLSLFGLHLYTDLQTMMVATQIDPPKATDQELVSQFLDGDERAFDLLYRRHVRKVAAIVYRITGQDEDLDDILQETFVEASQKLSVLRKGDSIRSWLITIAVRKVRRRISEAQRQRFLKSLLFFRVDWDKEMEPEKKNEVRSALASLPVKLRIPWVLHVLEGETIEETSIHCKISKATAKRRIREAGNRLERRLGP